MPKNKIIGVIQLGNKSEVLETLIAFKGYTQTYPDIHKTIILKHASNVLENLIREEFEEIIYLPELDKNSLEKNLEYLKAKILKISFSVLINLSYTKSSAYLCTIIEAKFKLGFKYSKNNYLNIEDIWSKYVYSVIMGKNLNPFSIVDIYKSVIGNKRATAKFPPAELKKIIFNIPYNKFEELITPISNQFPHLEIFIIGEPYLGLTNLKFKYVNSFEIFLKLNFEDALYIGNYSEYSLICSYKESFCINLYSSNLDPFLYMPYGIGNLSCLENINLNSLLKMINLRKNETALKTQAGNGYLIYSDRSNGDPYEIKEIFLQFYKYSFIICFEDIEETIRIPSVNEKTLNELDGYRNATDNLRELTLFGKKYSVLIIEELSKESPQIEKIKEYGQRIDEIDSLSNRLKKTYPLLGPAIDYFFHSKAMVQGDNLLEITQNVFFIYEEYSTFLEIILELINNMKSRFTIIEKGN